MKEDSGDSKEDDDGDDEPTLNPAQIPAGKNLKPSKRREVRKDTNTDQVRAPVGLRTELLFCAYSFLCFFGNMKKHCFHPFKVTRLPASFLLRFSVCIKLQMWR